MSQLNAVFEQSLRITRELEKVLEEEHEALVALDGDRIPALAEKKEQYFQSLIQLENQRQSIVPTPNADTARRVLNDYISTQKDAAQLQAQWDALRKSLKKIHRQNDINGRLVHLSQRNLARSLSLIKGQNPDAETYNGKGYTQAKAQSDRVITV